MTRCPSLLTAVVALLAGCARLPALEDYEVPASSITLARDLDAIRVEHAQPAIGAAVLRSNGEPVAAVVGERVVGEPAPVEVGDRFHIGSTTKTFTALLVAQLVADGKLAYDTTLSDALDLPMREAYRGVTLDQLLTNRAGLIALQRPDLEDPAHIEMLMTTIPATTSDPVEQRRMVATYALDQAPRFEPGSQGEYSNVGWAVLGHVLEEVEGTPYEQLVAERIFAPLGMTGARLGGWPASEADPEQPRGHYVDADGKHPQPLDDEYRLPDWMNPAGGVHCTLADLAAYAQEVLRGLQGRGELLGTDDYALMHQVHIEERVRRFYLERAAGGRSSWAMLGACTTSTDSRRAWRTAARARSTPGSRCCLLWTLRSWASPTPATASRPSTRRSPS